MNIAFFTNNYKPFVGGVPIAVENLALALRSFGHRVYIFAPDYGSGPDDDTDVFRTVSISDFNNSGFTLPVPLFLDVQVRFADLEVDIVHTHHPFILGQSGLHLARTREIPVVFTYHTQYERYAHYLPFDGEMVQDLAVKVAREYAKCCDAIVAPSDDIRKTLWERGVETPVSVIPTGVNLERFRRGDPAAFRARLGVPGETPLLLFVSRLAREKSVDTLLRVLAELSHDSPAPHLALVGSGDYEPDLRQLARELGVESLTHFVGTLTGDDLISAYRGADLFVFASTSETQGMVVLEAMAGGLPVVAVDAPGVRDVVTDGQNGFLVPEGDIAAFASRVRKILADTDLRASLIDGANQRACSLSTEATSRRVEALYQQVLQTHQPGGKMQKRFLILEQVLKYQVDRLAQGLEEILP